MSGTITGVNVSIFPGLEKMIKNKTLMTGILLTVLIFLIVNLYFYIKIIDVNSGEFAYGRDDPYIHLTMARNLVENGVWGISEDNPTSSSSSPLWTLILSAGFGVFGYNDEIPFYLNLIIALVLIVQLIKLFSRFSENKIAVLIWVNIIVYSAYLPRVVFMGMEHTMHIVLIVYVLSRLSDFVQDVRRLDLRFWVAIVLMSAVRYESLLIVGFLCLYFILSKKYKYAAFTLALGLLPGIVVGIFNLSIGGWVLPNSVLLRRSIFEFQWALPFTLVNNFFRSLQFRYEFPLIITLIFLALTKSDPKKNLKYSSFLAIAFLGIGTAVIHSMLGLMVARYFFYILVILLIALAIGQLIHMGEKKLTIPIPKDTLNLLRITLMIILSVGLFWNGLMDTRKTVLASKNIYEQQLQTSKFLGTYYQKEVTGVFDIGAVSFYSDTRIIDVAGLANNQVATLINSGTYDSKSLEKILRVAHAKIVIIPEVVVKRLYLDTLRWEYAGSWKIKNNVVCASDEIHFFGTNRTEANILRKNLEEFFPNLPKDVVYTKRWTE